MADEGIERLVRPELGAFGGYAASKAPETLAGKVEVPVENIIKLDANENPYGCSPRVNRALAVYRGISVYPDSGQIELRKQLEAYTGVGRQYIVASAGSDQLIDLLMRLFLEPGDEVINCPPTFAMYPFFTKLAGGVVVDVPRDAEFGVDVRGIKKAITRKTKMILLATPNNPTGTLMPREDIVEVLDTGLPVVVDEAYYEFTGQTMAPMIPAFGNMMVLRTFSKWAGLAGLRIGYGMFPAKIADYLMRIKEPYSVNVAAQVAVRESLADLEYLRKNVKKIIAERDRLFRCLSDFEWLKPYPSQANFILCSVLRGSAKELQKKLEEKGILVRYFDEPLLKDCVRVSVGKPTDTDRLVAVLKKLG